MAIAKQYYSKTLQFEGGISKNKDDNASKNPVPDGSGNHTNKGITWGTFKSLASKLNYVATPQLFYSMPDDLHYSIFLYFWKEAKADLIIDQPLGNLFFQFIWGGGFKNMVLRAQSILNKEFDKALKIDGSLGPVTIKTINDLNNDDSYKFHNMLVEARQTYLKSVMNWGSFGGGLTKKYAVILDYAKTWYTSQTPKKKTFVGISVLAVLFLILRKNTD